MNEGTGSISSDTKFQDFVRRLCIWRDLMARLHDESLRYVLSDYAVAALARKAPVSETDILNTILQADLQFDSSNPNYPLQSPSSVIKSHWEDLKYIFEDERGKPDVIYQLILKKHLGENGSCPLSLHNYPIFSKNNFKAVNRVIPRDDGLKLAKQVARKASRELFVQKFSCKSPVYHNCKIYANDGRLLCFCDRRKLEWYLHRDLAKLVEKDPPAIMLLFEPKGRPEDEGNDFYIQSKKNMCVGCGEENHYLRYRIIPSCYRMHFPEHLKSHRSHDIVLVCVDCHEIAHSATEKYKKQIAAEFGIPLFIRKVVDSSEARDLFGSSASITNLEDAGVSPLELRTAAMALLRHGTRMPSKRRKELKQIVMKYYGGREITEEDLERALVVGMSPHERRRVEKKRGVSFKNTARSISLDNELKNSSANSGSVAPTSNITESDFGFFVEASLGDGEGMSKQEPPAVLSSENRNSWNGCIASEETNPSAEVLGKKNSKLSLLGHGPHGKLVVGHLLREYGEDGIREFCQRWRQVFVDAIHPRFLPRGWDVTHSGKREFGEYSVYNPAKKASAQ